MDTSRCSHRQINVRFNPLTFVKGCKVVHIECGSSMASADYAQDGAIIVTVTAPADNFGGTIVHADITLLFSAAD
jgi:hypothetical protein